MQKTQFEETEQTSEPDSEVVRVFELSDGELKTTVINILRAVMGRADNMQEQMGIVSREMERIESNAGDKKKNTVTE